MVRREGAHSPTLIDEEALLLKLKHGVYYANVPKLIAHLAFCPMVLFLKQCTHPILTHSESIEFLLYYDIHY